MKYVSELGSLKTYFVVYPIVVGRPIKGYLANSADPDQTPQNAASDQGLHCLQIV